MLKVRQIKIPIDYNNKDYILNKISNKLKCNVNDITEEKLITLKKHNVNRLSIGVESFNKYNLKLNLASRIQNRVSFEDIINPETGEIMVEKDASQIMDELEKNGVDMKEEIKEAAKETPEMIKETVADGYQRMEDAVVGGYKKIEDGVVNAYKKIEDGVVGGYQKIENGAVKGFRKVSDFFIKKFFSRQGETVEETRKRLSRK